MPDENLDLISSEIATSFIQSWIYLKGIDHPALEEALAFIRSGLPFHEAAKQLAIWFKERLTVDPGVPGPFQDLSCNLIGTMLDQVDWKAIVGTMRRRED